METQNSKLSQTTLVARRPDGSVAMEASYAGGDISVGFPDSGRRGTYLGVPLITWVSLFEAADPVLYLLQNIKGYYRYQRAK